MRANTLFAVGIVTLEDEEGADTRQTCSSIRTSKAVKFIDEI